ncbi:MAG: hypothetical protein QGG36_29295 [Pirellulaceae bacterium]|jgi:hypothetical protein|nr:hypothetical protein [Pirellulaceae bacterium]MDP7019930.1 hypothetical protein [Pirellulaceae bacterium]
MATLMRSRAAPHAHSPTTEPRDEQQLQRDRWTATLVILMVFALMGFVIWLASVVSPGDHQGIEYWHMMP